MTLHAESVLHTWVTLERFSFLILFCVNTQRIAACMPQDLEQDRKLGEQLTNSTLNYMKLSMLAGSKESWRANSDFSEIVCPRKADPRSTFHFLSHHQAASRIFCGLKTWRVQILLYLLRQENWRQVLGAQGTVGIDEVHELPDGLKDVQSNHAPAESNTANEFSKRRNLGYTSTKFSCPGMPLSLENITPM